MIAGNGKKKTKPKERPGPKRLSRTNTTKSKTASNKPVSKKKTASKKYQTRTQRAVNGNILHCYTRILNRPVPCAQ